MSTVMTVDFAASDAAPHPAYSRIRLLSRALAWLFTGLIVVDGLFVAYFTAAFLIPFAGQHLGIGPTGLLLTRETHLPAPYIAVSSLPLLQRLAHIPVGLINFAPPLVIFGSLRRLFGLYARGEVFGRDNARCIQWIGGALAFNAAAPLVGVSFLGALHLAIDRTWMHAYSLPEMVLGAVVYVIALVMQAGHEIEAERSQFV